MSDRRIRRWWPAKAMKHRTFHNKTDVAAQLPLFADYLGIF